MISWGTRVDTWTDPTGRLTVTGPTVTDAQRTYVEGNVSFTFNIEQDGSKIQTVHTETDYSLTKDVPEDFEYTFTSTEGGSLTMVLDITDWSSP